MSDEQTLVNRTLIDQRVTRVSTGVQTMLQVVGVVLVLIGLGCLAYVLVSATTGTGSFVGTEYVMGIGAIAPGMVLLGMAKVLTYLHRADERALSSEQP